MCLLVCLTSLVLLTLPLQSFVILIFSRLLTGLFSSVFLTYLIAWIDSFGHEQSLITILNYHLLMGAQTLAFVIGYTFSSF